MRLGLWIFPSSKYHMLLPCHSIKFAIIQSTTADYFQWSSLDVLACKLVPIKINILFLYIYREVSYMALKLRARPSVSPFIPTGLNPYVANLI